MDECEGITDAVADGDRVEDELARDVAEDDGERSEERDADTVREVCAESVLLADNDSEPLDTMLGDASLVELIDCAELGETEVELVTL
jgi:hypothetical protein